MISFGASGIAFALAVPPNPKAAAPSPAAAIPVVLRNRPLVTPLFCRECEDPIGSVLVDDLRACTPATSDDDLLKLLLLPELLFDIAIESP